MMRRSAAKRVLVVSLAAATFLHAAPSWAHDKIDRVQLLNGDHLMGEIKRVERGILTYSTDSLDKVYIEWADIARLTSPYTYQVETSDGTRLFRDPVEPSSEGHLKIDWGETTVANRDGGRRHDRSHQQHSLVANRRLVERRIQLHQVERRHQLSYALMRPTGSASSRPGAQWLRHHHRPGDGTTSRQDYSLSGYRRYFGHRWFSAYS